MSDEDGFFIDDLPDCGGGDRCPYVALERE